MSWSVIDCLFTVTSYGTGWFGGRFPESETWLELVDCLCPVTSYRTIWFGSSVPENEA